ncbi:MAG TPA: MarR family transcriptional regulator [Gemmatimonadaceae bacterium]|nr:MarR family transcriptional regulator [Gemmatimonadaceae bacterium]
MTSKRPARPRRPTSGDAGDPQQRAVDAFRRIVRGLRVAAAETQADAGISAAQLFVLSQLQAAPAQSLSDLGTRTMTDRSSVATVVERLVERRLARSKPSAEDRRRTVIEITAAGRAVLRRAPRPPAARLVDGLASLGKRDLATLAHALEQLVVGMGLTAEPAVMLFADDDGAHGRHRSARRRPT